MHFYRTTNIKENEINSFQNNFQQKLIIEIQAVKIKYLKKLKNKTKRDRVRNDKIRKKFKVQTVLDSIKKQQLKSFEYGSRNDKEKKYRKLKAYKKSKKLTKKNLKQCNCKSLTKTP